MDETIAEYELVSDTDRTQFIGRINHLLNQNKGWKPLGSVAVATAPDGSTEYAQAMVRVGQPQ
jgi:hypothetical protein